MLKKIDQTRLQAAKVHLVKEQNIAKHADRVRVLREAQQEKEEKVETIRKLREK